MARSKDPRDAVRHIESHQTVFVHGAAATPNRLLEALTERAGELKNVELIHLHTIGPARYADHPEAFRVSNLFVGPNMRGRMDLEHVDYLPCFLSEIPQLFRTRVKKVHVALISLSPPDHHGLCSLGPSVDIARSAVDNADIVIAQINSRLPRSHGDSFVPLSRLTAWIECDDELPVAIPCKIEEDEKKIGALVAGIIEDGSTIQAGIGSVPDAVLAALSGHRHLGLHTEMWSDHMLELIEKGVIDNSRKKTHPGVSVTSFCYGAKKVYEAFDDNPQFNFLPADEVNQAWKIALNPKVVAINSAVEIDLTGQVCADSIGSKIISGVGGQMDFLRGAALSHGGKPILAMKSRTPKGRSKIVATLATGAGVVTTRAHVHYVVTEYGVTNLFGKTLNERAKALIALAHPDDREMLAKSWHQLARFRPLPE